MKLSRLLSRAVLAIAALASASAIAVPLTWTIQNGQFNDGGSFSGDFTVETDTSSLLAWNVTTTAGSVLPGYTYQNGTTTLALLNLWGANPNSILLSNFDHTMYVNLTFSGSLFSAGSNTILPWDGSTNSSWECTNCMALRAVTGGSITSGAVPEPGSLALMGLALAGLAARRRKQK